MTTTRTDKLFNKLGFTKILDDNLIVRYERDYPLFNFVQVIELCHKSVPVCFSYEKGTNSDNFSNAVGMTWAEMRLAQRKIREKGWL